VRIAVLHPQTPFIHGGAEIHTEALVGALREAGHDAEIVSIAGKWYPATELAHQMAIWRSFDIDEAPDGLRVDAVIALKFPAYLTPHERKIVWLIHQRRSAYELWDHPEHGDLAHQPEGEIVRDLVWQADRVALSEAKRVFTNSRNVKDRLWTSLKIPSEVLYHRSPAADALLAAGGGDHGDYIFYPSRLEALKRQSLVIEAMRHTTSGVRLVLVGRGPDEFTLRERIRTLGLEGRVLLEGRVSDARLLELYLGACAVYYGPFDEDYGYVTIEAMAAGKPIVTLRDSGGPLEFVHDERTGLVVGPEARAIARAFDRLATDADAAQRMGDEAQQLVRDVVPPWPGVVERLLD
jgi:glycosyltransferase involved in cell wall biosynthesis